MALEPHPNLQLQVPHRLRARGATEARGPGCQSRRIERAVRQVLRVDNREIGRAPVDDVPLAIVDDDDVERVEDVEPELEITVAAEANIPRDGEVHRVIGTAAE